LKTPEGESHGNRELPRVLSKNISSSIGLNALERIEDLYRHRKFLAERFRQARNRRGTAGQIDLFNVCSRSSRAEEVEGLLDFQNDDLRHLFQNGQLRVGTYLADRFPELQSFRIVKAQVEFFL